MAMRNLSALAESMVEQGFPPETPAAIVQSATLSTQAHVRTTISEMAAAATANGIGSPAVVTVGAVVNALGTAMTWDGYLERING
jgi:siroheme synthase